MLYHNVGKADRFLRVILGLSLIGAGIVWFPNYVLTFIMFVIGIVLLVTGIVGWCAIYSMMNYSSRRSGLNRITKKEIELAVRDYKVNESKALENLISGNVRLSSTKKISKKSVKKATKETTIKKSTKKTTKKVSKKTIKKSTKKPSAKKTSKK